MTCDDTYENLKDFGRLGLIPSEVQTKMDLSANSLVECSTLVVESQEVRGREESPNTLASRQQ